MGYFPFFVDLKGKTGVIIGGGTVALRKAETLLQYEASLVVIAKSFCGELWELQKTGALVCRQEAYDERALCGADYVIAATDDAAVNTSVYEWCKTHSVPVNVVDNPAQCSFYFPSLIKRGPLSVGVSTEGTSPTGAKYIRRQMESVIPEEIGAILEFLGASRERVMGAVAEEKRRAALFQKMFYECLDKKRAQTEEELDSLLREDASEMADETKTGEVNDGEKR